MTNFARFIRGVRIQCSHFSLDRFYWRNLNKVKLLVPFRLFVHPIETFNDIKFEGHGSLALANMIAFLYFIGQMMSFSMTSYLFNSNHVEQFNLFIILAQSLLLLLLWAVCNWSSGTLLNGEGTFRHIWIATCYAFLPILLFQLPLIALSNMFSLSEAMFYNAILMVMRCWTGVLLFLGMMVIHQFTVMRTVASVIITLILIFAIAFLVLLSYAIYQQLTAFIGIIITELSSR